MAYKYKPKIVKGKVSGTGWPIDGHVLYFSMWDYSPDTWHLANWDMADDEAVMRTMYQTEQEVGDCLYDTLEAFAEAWESGAWEPAGIFFLDLDKVEVLEVLQEEEKDEPRESEKARFRKIGITPRKDTDLGGTLCLPLAENLKDDVRAKHPDWELMDCPQCGRKCWKPAGVDELQQKQGVRLLCTQCALYTTTPCYSDNTQKPEENRGTEKEG